MCLKPRMTRRGRTDSRSLATFCQSSTPVLYLVTTPALPASRMLRLLLLLALVTSAVVRADVPVPISAHSRTCQVPIKACSDATDQDNCRLRYRPAWDGKFYQCVWDDGRPDATEGAVG